MEWFGSSLQINIPTIHARRKEERPRGLCVLAATMFTLSHVKAFCAMQSVLFRLGPSLHFTPPPLMTIATTFARENAVFVTEPVGFKLARLDRWWWCAVEELPPRVTVGPGRRRMKTARRGDRERNCNLQSKEGRKKGREGGGREGGLVLWQSVGLSAGRGRGPTFDGRNSWSSGKTIFDLQTDQAKASEPEERAGCCAGEGCRSREGALKSDFFVRSKSAFLRLLSPFFQFQCRKD